MISKSLSAAPVIAYCLDFFSLYFGNFLRASVELCYIAFDLQDEEAFSQQFLGLLLSPDMESVHEQAHKPTSPQAHKPTSIGLANFRFLRRI